MKRYTPNASSFSLLPRLDSRFKLGISDPICDLSHFYARVQSLAAILAARKKKRKTAISSGNYRFLIRLRRRDAPPLSYRNLIEIIADLPVVRKSP